MMRKDLTTSLALAAAAFLCTCGMLYWMQRGKEVPVQQRRVQQLAKPARLAETAAVQTPPVQAQLRPPRQSRLAPVAEAGALPPAVAAPVDIPPGPSEGAAKPAALVPVSVLVRKSPAGVFEVRLQNTSSESTEVGATLTDSNNNTRAELAFTAEPHSVRILGMNDGWKLESGDQVTVTSPPFGERVLKVP